MTVDSIAPTAPQPADARLITFAARAMASPLRLSIATSTDQAAVRRAASAWTAVRLEFEASEQAMSRFRETSEITGLNRRAGDGRGSLPSRRLLAALAACDRAYRLTDGRFDPRVLTALERLGDRGASIGRADGSVAPGRARGGRIVDCEPGGQIRLSEPIDLGGIGKGLALRWAASAVRRAGFEAFLIDAGGDLVTSEQPPEGGPWRIGIEDPGGGMEPVAVIAARNNALATSSVRRRRWKAGDRIVHHLIDPFTGEPGGEGLLAVTVAGLDPAWAEVWSKALFMEGRAGIAGLASRRALAAWWVADDGSLEMTAAARLQTLWRA